jgi:hypothetical protein
MKSTSAGADPAPSTTFFLVLCRSHFLHSFQSICTVLLIVSPARRFPFQSHLPRGRLP